MSIYFTVPSAGVSSQAFLDRELGGRGPTQINQSNIYVVGIGAINDSVNSLISHIHEVGGQTGNGFLTKTHIKNCFKPLPDAPLSAPVTMIDTKRKGGADELKAFNFRNDTALPPSFSVAANLKPSQLREVFKLGYELGGSSYAGNVNPYGALAFHYAWHAVRLFLRVGDRKDIHAAVERVLEDAEYAAMPTLSDGVRDIDDGYARNECQDVMDGDMGTRRLVRMEKTTLVIPDTVSYSGTVANRVGHGSNVRVRDVAGFVFEYFEGMLLPSNIVADIFFRYFSRSLSDTTQGLSTIMPQLRRGFQSLKSTSAGLILQHVFFGMQSCIESGSVMRIIIDRGEYKGFVLQGEDIRVLKDGDVLEPIPAKNIGDYVRAMDQHIFYVRKIIEKLAGMEILGSGEKTVPDEALLVGSSRAMAREVYRRKCEDKADRDEIVGWLGSLRYGGTFKEKNPENVIAVFELLRQQKEPGDDVPFYFGAGDYAFSDNIFIRILSMFGPKAPTLSSRSGNQTYTLVNQVYTKLPDAFPYFPFYERNLGDAAEMWAQVIRTRQVRTHGAKKKGSGKVFERAQDVGHIGGPQGLEMMNGLVTWAFSKTSGVKRKTADEIISEAERVAKRKRVVEESVDMF